MAPLECWEAGEPIFEELIREHFLDNPHKATVVLKPVPGTGRETYLTIRSDPMPSTAISAGSPRRAAPRLGSRSPRETGGAPSRRATTSVGPG